MIWNDQEIVLLLQIGTVKFSKLIYISEQEKKNTAPLVKVKADLHTRFSGTERIF